MADPLTHVTVLDLSRVLAGRLGLAEARIADLAARGVVALGEA